MDVKFQVRKQGNMFGVPIQINGETFIISSNRHPSDKMYINAYDIGLSLIRTKDIPCGGKQKLKLLHINQNAEYFISMPKKRKSCISVHPMQDEYMTFYPMYPAISAVVENSANILGCPLVDGPGRIYGIVSFMGSDKNTCIITPSQVILAFIKMVERGEYAGMYSLPANIIGTTVMVTPYKTKLQKNDEIIEVEGTKVHFNTIAYEVAKHVKDTLKIKYRRNNKSYTRKIKLKHSHKMLRLPFKSNRNPYVHDSHIFFELDNVRLLHTDNVIDGYIYQCIFKENKKLRKTVIIACPKDEEDNVDNWMVVKSIDNRKVSNMTRFRRFVNAGANTICLKNSKTIYKINL